MLLATFVLRKDPAANFRVVALGVPHRAEVSIGSDAPDGRGSVVVLCANKYSHVVHQRLLPICSPHSHLISQYVFLKFPPKRIILAIPRTLRHRPEGIQPEDRK